MLDIDSKARRGARNDPAVEGDTEPVNPVQPALLAIQTIESRADPQISPSGLERINNY
jgi:hypothetical protein